MKHVSENDKKVKLGIKITKWKLDEIRRLGINQSQTIEDLLTKSLKLKKPEGLQ